MSQNTTGQSSGYLDTFTGLLGTYFTYKTAEAKAEASGAAQAQHSNTVETTANVNQVPNQTILEAGQGITTNQMLIGGGAALLIVLLVLK